MNSTHKCEVVPLKLHPHPDADLLSVVYVDGYSCVTQTAQWAGKELCCFCPPDNYVDTKRPEFSFLAEKANSEGYAKIKAIKLRGIPSFGLLFPAPNDAKIGDDLTEYFGIKHYVPQINSPKNKLFSSGEIAIAPDIYLPKYDLEAGRKYGKLIPEGTSVMIMEKANGENSRYVYKEGKMHCGSRNLWKKEFSDHSHVTIDQLISNGCEKGKAELVIEKLINQDKNQKKNKWWHILDVIPQLKEFCISNPEIVVYGELIGGVGGYNYGLKPGELSFVCFDMMKNGQWLNPEELIRTCIFWKIPIPPIYNEIIDEKLGASLQPIPFNFDKICELAEGKTAFKNASHIKEGVVVTTFDNSYHPKIGRMKLKWVSCSYLEKKKGFEVEQDEE